jgi:hypothetical protein
MADDDFWDDLVAHVRQGVLIPITGPDLNVVVTDGVRHTLTELIAQELAKRYGLDISPEQMTMGEAAAAFLRKRGRDEDERLYRVVNDIINQFDERPCEPLRELAAIMHFHLFVSTTPDRLLANAVNDVRFGGLRRARELTFSPNQSTSEQARNLHAPAESDTTVVRLFGQAASTPQYAVHDEDLLEWLHALLSGIGGLPDWIASALKDRPLLFIGCDMPDWLGRFLLRLSSSKRIWLESKQFFFVGRSVDDGRAVPRALLLDVLPPDPGATTPDGTRGVRLGAAAPFRHSGRAEEHLGPDGQRRTPDVRHADDLHQLPAGGHRPRPPAVRPHHRDGR